jgi:hypothetical protein
MEGIMDENTLRRVRQPRSVAFSAETVTDIDLRDFSKAGAWHLIHVQTGDRLRVEQVQVRVVQAAPVEKPTRSRKLS